MSQENVEVVRGQIDAFNRGDYEAALAVLDEDVEWHVPDVAALDAPASGGHGEQVFVAGVQVGRGRHSGLDVSVPTFHVFTLRDHRIVVMRTFPDRAAALEAAGLRG